MGEISVYDEIVIVNVKNNRSKVFIYMIIHLNDGFRTLFTAYVIKSS